MIRDVTLCLASLCTIQYIVIYIFFDFEEKTTFYFSNYDEFMYGTSGDQYLQQRKEPLS